MTVLMVPEDDLVVLGDLYPRHAVDAERVVLFAELLQENPSALRPIRAAHVDGVAGYVISDGVHRLHAYRKIGTKDIPVEVWPANSTGTVYIDALRTATESAAPLTRTESRRRSLDCTPRDMVKGRSPGCWEFRPAPSMTGCPDPDTPSRAIVGPGRHRARRKR
jgi:hypothetical protein